MAQEGNEEALLEILTSHSLEQREIVAKEYKMHHRKVGKQHNNTIIFTALCASIHSLWIWYE
jgi:hypothetical protein